jgi:hypothetical protein
MTTFIAQLRAANFSGIEKLPMHKLKSMYQAGRAAIKNPRTTRKAQ